MAKQAKSFLCCCTDVSLEPFDACGLSGRPGVRLDQAEWGTHNFLKSDGADDDGIGIEVKVSLKEFSASGNAANRLIGDEVYLVRILVPDSRQVVSRIVHRQELLRHVHEVFGGVVE